ncbi:hypothetical protein BGZ88_003396 [Linnemannia elongata]|nr:hypothetical protein BGZ88_003396 [Linnemannia elongata]
MSNSPGTHSEDLNTPKSWIHDAVLLVKKLLGPKNHNLGELKLSGICGRMYPLSIIFVEKHVHFKSLGLTHFKFTASDWKGIISSNSLVRKLTIAQQCEFLDHKSDENQNDNTEAEDSTPGVKRTLTGNRLSVTNNSVLSSNGGATNGGSKKRRRAEIVSTKLSDGCQNGQRAEYPHWATGSPKDATNARKDKLMRLELDFGRSTKSQHRLTCILSTLQECAELREFSYYNHAQDKNFKEKMFKNLGTCPTSASFISTEFLEPRMVAFHRSLARMMATAVWMPKEPLLQRSVVRRGPKLGKALKLPFFDVALLEHVKGLPNLSGAIITEAIYRKKLY